MGRVNSGVPLLIRSMAKFQGKRSQMVNVGTVTMEKSIQQLTSRSLKVKFYRKSLIIILKANKRIAGTTGVP